MNISRASRCVLLHVHRRGDSGSPARHRVDQLLQLRPGIRLLDLEGAPPTTLATNLHQVVAARTSTSLVPSLSNRADRKARRTCHGGHATPPNRVGLGARPQPTRALVHRRLQQAPLLADESLNLHAKRRSRRRDPVDPLSYRFDRIVRPRALTVTGACPDAGLTCYYGEGVICYCTDKNDGGASWVCLPEGPCLATRPRLGSPCQGTLDCTYVICGYGQECVLGVWQPSQLSCN